ncbi:hypothetical protein Ahy_A01g003820 [Arachis hypogaea]|uniref:DNA-directed RNA polymerase subunit n=1 Tax=Arachis hypogaea TaxID=3818 RepID=A0A445ETX3_ARAHY|nr:hypothetical protein Ahy_A01g003820 [Arachis hypogaea]
MTSPVFRTLSSLANLWRKHASVYSKFYVHAMNLCFVWSWAMHYYTTSALMGHNDPILAHQTSPITHNLKKTSLKPLLPLNWVSLQLASVGVLRCRRLLRHKISKRPSHHFSKIEHTLPLPAPQLSRPIREAIHTELEKLFLDKVIANLGLCISVYDIKSIEGGFIYPGDGAPTYTVVFNLIMFRPFVGEIMTAKLLSSDADGLRLSLGFFDDIYVPLQHLPSPNEFKAESKNSTKGTWYWKYEEQSYPVDDSDMIKFRIQNVTYPSIPVEQPKESKPFAPMLVTGSIDHDGLGPVSWWPGQEEDAEEEEEETAAEE